MSAVRPSTVCAVAVLALVFAQDVVPGLDFYHTWQYAALLALTSIVVVVAAWPRRMRAEGLAALGVAVVALAGLASALLGPDTATVARAPGTVAPLPSLGAAAFFSPADAQAVARGDSAITLRRPGRPALELASGGRRIYGPSVLTVRPQNVAYVEAYTASGDRLTVTQPSNPAFLSPLLLFTQTQRIAGKTLPYDAFALPAKNLIVHAVYFTAGATRTMTNVPASLRGSAAILFAVDDAQDRPIGIAIGTGGKTVDAGSGIRLRATFGTYPALQIASAPYPLALAGGIALAVAGLAAIAWRRRSQTDVWFRSPSCS